MPLVNGKYQFPTIGVYKPQPQQGQPQQVQPQQPQDKPLPDGAKAWTPFGTPYFGDGTLVGDFVGKLKEYAWNFNKDYTPPPEGTPDFQKVKQAWAQLPSATKAGENLAEGKPVEKQGAGQIVGELANAVTTTQQAVEGAAASNGLLYPIYKGLGVSLQALGDLFTVPAQLTEQTLGAIEATRNISLDKTTDQNWQQIVQGWQAGKIFWTQVGNAVKSGDVFYTLAQNNVVRDEYIKRLKAGEDPNLLAMKLADPISEAVGQIVVDPLNVLGGFIKDLRYGKVLETESDFVKATGVLANPEIPKVIEELGKVQDVTKAPELVTRLADEVIKTPAVLGKQEYNLFRLSATGSQEKALRNGGLTMENLISTMAVNGYGTDDTINMVGGLVQMASTDRKEVALGISAAMHFPSPKLMFSQPYRDLGVTIRNLLKDENGVVDTSKFLDKLGNERNLAEFTKSAGELLDKAVHAQYPTVAEMAKAAEKVGAGEASAQAQKLAKLYEGVPTWVKKFAVVVKPAEDTKNWINTALGRFYFSLQYSVASRNITNNTVQILIDEGLGSFYSEGKWWSIKNLGNEMESWKLPRESFAAGGFTSFAEDVTGKAKGSNVVTQAINKVLTAPASPAGLMQRGEQAAAMQSFGKMFRDSMKKLLDPKYMGGEILSKAGWNDGEVARAMRLLYENRGDAHATIQAIRELHANGSMDAWRAMETYLKPGQIDAYREVGMYDELAGLLSNKATTKEQLDTFFQQAEKAFTKRAGLSLGDAAGVGQDVLGAETIGHLQDAAESGQLRNTGPNTVLASFLQEADTAIGKFSGALNSSYDNVLRNVGQNPAVDNLTQMTQDWRKFVQEDGAHTRQVVLSTFYTTRQQLVELGKAQTNDLPRLWKLFDLGSVPEKLDKGAMRNAIWSKYRDTASALWTKHYTTLFDQTRPIVEELGKFSPDKNQVQSLFSDAEKSMLRAQAYRSGEIEKGILHVPDMAGGKLAVPPAYPEGSTPSIPRAWHENLQGNLDLVAQTKQAVSDRWGQKVAAPLDKVTERAMADWGKIVAQRVPEAKLIATRTAKYWRDFTLHAYGEKTYFDLALSYIYPYNFWYTRTYGKWLTRIVTDPQVVAGYSKYKQLMAEVHSNAPEWYKYQVNSNELLGINSDHPLFFNLEASLNPMNGLTGVDFNDRNKRIDWWTKTLDDMNKFGPSVWAPMQLATAIALQKRGEADAASRWGGRLIPETQVLKGLSSYLGKPVELDPSVNYFSGGLDPYERGRVGNFLSGMVGQTMPDGTPITREMAVDAAHTQSGPLWDQAYQQAAQQRAMPQLVSYLAGIGWKPRNQNDVAIEQMYGELNAVYASKDGMSPDQYKASMNQLSLKYPFMDTVLLARKGGNERDAAFAYNVIGRLPPGDLGSTLKTVGITSQEIDKFFASKGFTDPKVNFTDTEKTRFMSAVLDLATMLKIPDNATRQEWTTAKKSYQDVYAFVQTKLGKDIWDKVSHYYNLQDTNPDQANAFRNQHPEIAYALQMKRAATVSDPLLAKYYGGIDTIEAYVDGLTRQKLITKYGNGILAAQNEYYNYADPREAKKFLSQHPELRKYWADKAILDERANQMIVAFSQRLPAQAQVQFRPNFIPQSPTQEAFAKQLQPNQVDPLSIIPPGHLQAVKDYWQKGTPLNSRTTKELDYLAKQYGFYNGDDLLRRAGIALFGGK